MIIKDVEKALLDIAECAGDPERAHILEDKLYREILLEISTSIGPNQWRDLATAALRSSLIDFPRWCA